MPGDLLAQGHPEHPQCAQMLHLQALTKSLRESQPLGGVTVLSPTPHPSRLSDQSVAMGKWNSPAQSHGFIVALITALTASLRCSKQLLSQLQSY